MKNIEIREFFENEVSLVNKCIFCIRPFGDVWLPAIEFHTDEKIVDIIADHSVVVAFGKKCSAPYECYSVEPVEVDINKLKLKIVTLGNNVKYRITYESNI